MTTKVKPANKEDGLWVIDKQGLFTKVTPPVFVRNEIKGFATDPGGAKYVEVSDIEDKETVQGGKALVTGDGELHELQSGEEVPVKGIVVQALARSLGQRNK